MQYHLAILQQPWLYYILSGKKTIESRFTKIRCAPYNKVHTGDLVYLKESGGLVKGQFTVSKVETYSDLSSEILRELHDRYHRKIFVEPQFQGFWKKWSASKYATLIHVDNVVEYQNPFPFKKKDGRAWVYLDKPMISSYNCKQTYSQIVEIEDPRLEETYTAYVTRTSTGWSGRIPDVPEVNKCEETTKPVLLKTLKNNLYKVIKTRSDAWDKQIEEDIKAGKLDHLREEILEDIEAGRLTDL